MAQKQGRDITLLGTTRPDTAADGLAAAPDPDGDALLASASRTSRAPGSPIEEETMVKPPGPGAAVAVDDSGYPDVVVVMHRGGVIRKAYSEFVLHKTARAHCHWHWPAAATSRKAQ